MAAVTDSTPAPARRLLRAAGSGRALTTAEVIGLVADAAPVIFDPVAECADPALCAPSAAGRHAQVLRQHDLGTLSRVCRNASVILLPLGNRRSSSFILSARVRLRS